MIFGINTTCDNYFKIVSDFTRLTAREITYNNFEIFPVVCMPNITTNHAITYTNTNFSNRLKRQQLAKPMILDIVHLALCIIMDQDLVAVNKKSEKRKRPTSSHPDH